MKKAGCSDGCVGNPLDVPSHCIYDMQDMSANRIHRNSPIREILGRPVAATLDIVGFSPEKTASLVQKTLKSALANAEPKQGSHNAVEGVTIERFIPKARATAGRISKRTCHIYITLGDEVEIEVRAPKRKTKKNAPKKRPAHNVVSAKAKQRLSMRQLAPRKQERLSLLMGKNNEGSLTQEEMAELSALGAYAEELSLQNARLAAETARISRAKNKAA
jgi:large subunit ribosomal protein L22